MHVTRNQMRLEEHARNHHFVRPPQGFSAKDALNPENWAHVSFMMKQWDKVSIAPEDGSWYGEYVALQVKEQSVLLFQTSYTDLGASIDLEDEANSGVPKGYKVSYGGPKEKYRVQRLSDGKVLTAGLLKAEAIAWAVNDAKAVAA